MKLKKFARGLAAQPVVKFRQPYMNGMSQ